MEAVENRSKEALNIVKNNKIMINNFEDLLEEKTATKIPGIVKQVKNDFQITKLEGQIKSVLTVCSYHVTYAFLFRRVC